MLGDRKRDPLWNGPEIIPGPRLPSWWDPILQEWRADFNYPYQWEDRMLFHPDQTNHGSGSTWRPRDTAKIRYAEPEQVELGERAWRELWAEQNWNGPRLYPAAFTRDHSWDRIKKEETGQLGLFR